MRADGELLETIGALCMHDEVTYMFGGSVCQRARCEVSCSVNASTVSAMPERAAELALFLL